MRHLTTPAVQKPPAGRAGTTLVDEHSCSPSATVLGTAELLSRWQAWSDRNTLTHQVSTARAAGEAEQVAILTRAMRAAAGITPLDALAANHQLAQLLIAQQPQAIHAARTACATWDQIAAAIGTTAEQACTDWLAHSGPPSRPTTSAADDRIVATSR